MATRYRTVTLEDAQATLNELCDAALSKEKVILIKRPKGSPVALLAAQELSSLMESLYLLSSPRNSARLITALRRAQRR